jgi:hypothetical protein
MKNKENLRRKLNDTQRMHRFNESICNRLPTTSRKLLLSYIKVVENSHLRRHFSWDRVALHAAKNDLNDALRTIVHKVKLKDETLNQALSYVTNHNGHRTTVHALMEKGANANARIKGIPLHVVAFKRGRAAAFEEMIMWSDKLDDRSPGHKDLFGDKGYFRTYLRDHTASQRNASLATALDLYDKKQEIRRMGASRLRQVYAQSVQHEDAVTAMAAYAESLRMRFPRGRIRFNDDIGKRNTHAASDGILLMLKTNRFQIATHMVDHGYDPEKTSHWGQLRFNEKATTEQRLHLEILKKRHARHQAKRKDISDTYGAATQRMQLNFLTNDL